LPVFEHFLESLFGPLLNAAVETWTISRHFQFESRALFEMCKGLGLAGEMQDDGNMGDGRRRLSLVELVTSVLKLGKHPRLKTDSGSPKRPNKIPNCWLMKHGNPRYGKYGIENSQRVGYHAPLQRACFPCSGFSVACISVLPGALNGIPKVVAASSKSGPIPISASPGLGLSQIASWDQGA
jgi:hypothetical protein